MAKKYYSKLFKNKILILFALWCLILIFSSFQSQFILLSLESSLFYFRYGILSLSICFFLYKFEHSLVYFNYLINFLLIFLIFDGFLQYITGNDIFGFEKKSNRLSGPFKEEYILGGVIAKLLPIFLVCNLYFNKKIEKNHKIIILSVIFFSGIIILLSGERWSLIFYIIYIFLLIFFLNLEKLKISFNKLLLYFLAVIIFIFSLIFFLPLTNNSKINLKDRFVNFTLYQLDAKDEIYFDENNEELKITNIITGVRIFSLEHQAFYETGIKIFLDNKLFGSGPKTFREICKYKEYQVKVKNNKNLVYNGCQTHPHNYYIQLFAETGLIGALPFVIFYIYIFYLLSKHLFLRIFKNKYLLSNYSIFLLIPIFILFFPILPSTNLFSSWNSFFIYFIFGFLIKDQFSLFKNN